MSVVQLLDVNAFLCHKMGYSSSDLPLLHAGKGEFRNILNFAGGLDGASGLGASQGLHAVSCCSAFVHRGYSMLWYDINSCIHRGLWSTIFIKLLRGALISFVQIAALASGKKSFCTLQGTLLDKNGSVPLLEKITVLTAAVCVFREIIMVGCPSTNNKSPGWLNASACETATIDW